MAGQSLPVVAIEVRLLEHRVGTTVAFFEQGAAGERITPGLHEAREIRTPATAGVTRCGGSQDLVVANGVEGSPAAPGVLQV